MTQEALIDSEADRADVPLWWTQPFSMFQTNLRAIDVDMDVDATATDIVAFGATAWLISVGGIVANYPTELPFQRRNPGLAARRSGDLIGDAVHAAKSHDLHLVARIDFSKVGGSVAADHPEWCFRGADGSQQIYNGLTTTCPSGDYYQLKIIEVLDEILDHYPLDGFFFNWMSFNEIDYSKRYRGVCQCEACIAGFERFAPGSVLPTDRNSANYQQWQAYATATIDGILERVRAHLHRRRREAPLIMRGAADVSFHEANNEIGRAYDPFHTAEQVSLAFADRPDAPVVVNAVAFVDMPYRFASENPFHFEQYLVQAISRGANPSTYVLGTARTAELVSVPAASTVTKFFRDHLPIYRGLRSAARIALVRRDPHRHWGDELGTASDEYTGLTHLLTRIHAPFDFIAEASLALRGADGLSRYDLIVLPDLGQLGDREADVLDAYVRAGGAILATGSSGLMDTDDNAAFGRVEKLRANIDSSSTWASYEVPTNGGELLAVNGARYDVSVPPDATTTGYVLSQAPFGPPELCSGHEPIIGQVSSMTRTVGAGRVRIVPWTIGVAFRNLALTGYQTTFETLVRDLIPPAALPSTTLPDQVELTVGRSQAGCLIHLRNLTGISGQYTSAPIAIGKTELRLHDAAVPKSIRALVHDSYPEWRIDGDELIVEVPPLALFEVILIIT